MSTRELTGYRRTVGVLDVAVDDGGCIVLIIPDGQRYTVSNVGALTAALDDARTYARTLDDA